MRCEFCSSHQSDAEPENVALLLHVEQRDACKQQLGYLLENLNTSWTKAMSGG